MLDAEIRMEILKILIPQATRVGIIEPKHIIDSARTFEKYVLDFNEGGDLPDSPAKRKPGRPKRTTENEMPGFLDPTHSG